MRKDGELPERQDFFQVKCPNPKCRGIKTTYARIKTICPYCGRTINVVKCRVKEDAR